jgi:hypothetical protein
LTKTSGAPSDWLIIAPFLVTISNLIVSYISGFLIESHAKSLLEKQLQAVGNPSVPEPLKMDRLLKWRTWTGDAPVALSAIVPPLIGAIGLRDDIPLPQLFVYMSAALLSFGLFVWVLTRKIPAKYVTAFRPLPFTPVFTITLVANIVGLVAALILR